MSVQCLLFPFSVVSNLGKIQKVTGSITVTIVNLDITKTVEFTTESTTWQEPTAHNQIVVPIPANLFVTSDLIIDLEVILDCEETVALFFKPATACPKELRGYMHYRHQEIVGTDFLKTNDWHNLPITSGQQARSLITLFVAESEKSVLDKIANNVTFREELTYVERKPTKDLPIEENIEYYLGKDTVKNIYFKKEIPAANAIPSRPNPAPIGKTVIGWEPNDSTEYQYNNLGYRSAFDYNIDKLKNKKVIICLGDSDTFGIGIDYDKTWPGLLKTEATVLNMSVPGISLDGLTRIGAQTIQALTTQVEAVLIQYPLMSLREFVSKDFKGGVHTHRNFLVPYEDWWKHIDWQSNNYSFNKNRLLLESICGKYNIKYFDLYINRNDNKIPYDFFEFNVYTSFGPKTHQAIANYFTRKLNNQPSLYQKLTQS